jgi:CRP-like cAMP-binding protein
VRDGPWLSPGDAKQIEGETYSTSEQCWLRYHRCVPVFDLLRNEPDIRKFVAGDVIFAEGDAGDSMYAVIEGEIEIRKRDKIVDTVSAGGVFGEMALIDQEPRSATAVAKNDCRVVAVGQRRFTLLVQQTPYFALQIMHVLADRLRKNTIS